jgi:hypothetical protein
MGPLWPTRITVRGQEWVLRQSGPNLAGELAYVAIYGQRNLNGWHVQISIPLYEWMENDTVVSRRDLVEAKLTDAVALAETLVH